QQHSADNTGAAVSPAGGAQEKGAPPHRRTASTVQGLQREIRRLQEQLRSNEELNATLRSELDLHRSIIAQTSFSHQEQDPGQDQEVSGPQTGAQKQALYMCRSVEYVALRQRLEESISTNDRLREQLERRLAEVEKDPGSHEETPQSVPVSSCGSVNLGDLLSEIRHLRLQLERSIQTNTALRQKLEEQLLRGPSRSETININYLLSSPGIHRALSYWE
ncbi:hypothetical protein XENOCAPTIV_006150, partial [Xenoophorus captivus]